MSSNFIHCTIKTISWHLWILDGPPHVLFLIPIKLKFLTLIDALHAFLFLANRRSWSMVKQSVDATFADIRKRELLAELELRVIEVQCSAPVMWIAPSQRICHGFPMKFISDLCPTSTSVISANKVTSPNHQNFHLSLCVLRASIICHCHCAHAPPSRVTVAFA